MANKVAVVGDSYMVLLAKAGGLRACAANSAGKACEHIEKLVREGYNVIYLVNEYYEGAMSYVTALRLDPKPMLIPIPSGRNVKSVGKAELHKNVERAIGFDILSNNSDADKEPDDKK